MINYEFPNKAEDYVHRIGRTGRAGAKGLAVTFMAAADAKHAGALVKIGSTVLGGGGGGKDDFAQGGGVDPSKSNEALSAISSALAG